MMKEKATVSAKQIAACLAQLKKVVKPFAEVPPLSADDRKRLAKLKRGAHQVVPTIADLARKFAIEAPGMSVDDMMSNLQHAQRVEPLLNFIAAFHQTLKDEYLASSGAAWKTATVTYRMLSNAGDGNRRVADELEQVTKWFRHKGRRKKAAAENGQPSKAGKTKAETPASAGPTEPEPQPAAPDAKASVAAAGGETAASASAAEA